MFELAAVENRWACEMEMREQLTLKILKQLGKQGGASNDAVNKSSWELSGCEESRKPKFMG
jgi:hypothetical protein